MLVFAFLDTGLGFRSWHGLQGLCTGGIVLYYLGSQCFRR